MSFSLRISYILLFTSIVFLLSGSIGIADNSNDTCETKKGYELYTCRIKKICEVYKPEKPIYKKEKYSEASELGGGHIGADSEAPALEAAKKIYRENMGNTYKCVMVQSQKNALDFLKNQLKAEKSGKIDDTIGRQIDLKINKLELTANTLKCSLTEKDSFTVKSELLKETTYEMCHYISYLEYLKVFYGNTENALGINHEGINTLYEEEYNVGHIGEIMAGIQGKIIQEIDHTYKIFPLVFHAYSEYENNFPIHFMLEIIHADFLLLRQRLYETVMPIAQVGYKIINAMSY